MDENTTLRGKHDAQHGHGARSCFLLISTGKRQDLTPLLYNLFVEPQYTVAEKGPGQPKQQIFLGFNVQF